MTKRFYARSASDKTDDWPFWYVADSYQSDLNVTTSIEAARDGCTRIEKARFLGVFLGAFGMQPFLAAYDAAKLAKWANDNLGDRPQAMWGAA